MEVKDAAGQRLAARWLREDEITARNAGQNIYEVTDWNDKLCTVGEQCDYETFQEFLVDQLYVAMRTDTTKEFMAQAGYENDPKEILSDMLMEDDDEDWYKDQAESMFEVTYMGDL
ncbi:hypothetical protein [Lactobacillus sp. ESL0677]|uniref:hypothetical protein n=1 Tax=Lactobacillus sp. ESL0677 TaxID=2983208 RepID=UPI0023F99CBD|nr:hypothetical protein [Lactobacillus sp. ESL0677]WEV36249.1 hypothetical protein OZX76_05745 [Lactobacillus sp. ESL0677]